MRSFPVLTSEALSSIGRLIMSTLCGLFDCGCFPVDLKSWFPLTFRTPRYFILQFGSSSFSLIPSDDTYLVWTAVDPVACLLYLDREVESWSGCGCPGGPWGQVVHATSLRQSNQVNICYIYIIYIIYSILILTGLDLLAACFVWIAWFYGESILPLSEFSCI